MQLNPFDRRSEADSSESGVAMVITLTVIMVVSLLSVTVLARTLSGLGSARRDQDFQAALALADTGVSNALLRLDQLSDADFSGACPGGVPMPCTVEIQNGAIKYTMTKESADAVSIRSRGVVNGVPHAVEATAFRSRLYPFAIFGANKVDFSGSKAGYITSSPADLSTSIGTNGTLKCVPVSPADEAVVYPPGDDTSCGSVPGEGEYDPQPPSESCPAEENTPKTPCLPLNPLVCPIDVTITYAVGETRQLQSLISGGAYRCTEPVRFPPVLTVGSGIVELFIFPPDGVQPFDLGESVVNPGGDATKFRLYSAGTGNEISNGVKGFTFNGILWAPGVRLRSNGCNAAYNGAVIVAEFDCNGGPNLTFNYDSRISVLYDQNWRTRDFSEIPSSRVP